METKHTLSEAEKMARRDAVATWDEIRDELIYESENPESISELRLAWFCERFPHFDDRLREYVKNWNSSPRITEEMLDEVGMDISEEELNNSFFRVKQIFDFVDNLRVVEKQRDQLAECLRECEPLILYMAEGGNDKAEILYDKMRAVITKVGAP